MKFNLLDKFKMGHRSSLEVNLHFPFLELNLVSKHRPHPCVHRLYHQYLMVILLLLLYRYNKFTGAYIGSNVNIDNSSSDRCCGILMFGTTAFAMFRRLPANNNIYFRRSTTSPYGTWYGVGVITFFSTGLQRACRHRRLTSIIRCLDIRIISIRIMSMKYGARIRLQALARLLPAEHLPDISMVGISSLSGTISILMRVTGSCTHGILRTETA